MGDLVWTNSSSYTVQWFVVTPLGSVADVLEPGQEYRHENDSEIGQVGIQCLTAPVYVINVLNRADGVDVHLVASDGIPMTD